MKVIVFVAATVALHLLKITLASFDCEVAVSSKESIECCEIPKFYPEEIIQNCTLTYEGNTKNERTKKLDGPRRGDVRL